MKHEQAAALAKEVGTNRCADSFTQLYEAYKRPMFKRISKSIHNHGDAEEVSQEAWLKVWSKLSTFQGNSTLWTWLTHVVDNTVLDYHRRKAKDMLAQAHSLSSHEDLDWMLSSQDGADPMNIMIAEEMRAQVDKAVELLPVKTKRAYEMYESGDYGYIDIARVLEISENAAYQRVHQARQHITKHLEENGND